MQSTRTCTFHGCGRPQVSRGYCHGHYDQWSLGRQLSALRLREKPGTPLAARLANRSTQEGECLVWTGAKNVSGYGVIKRVGESSLAHRAAYELVHGPTSENLVIDHKCHNPACIRVEHLQAVTPSENSQNLGGLRPNNTSGFRGVYLNKKTGRFQVWVTSRGRRFYGGSHVTADEANRAAVDLRNKVQTNNLRDRADNASDESETAA